MPRRITCRILLGLVASAGPFTGARAQAASPESRVADSLFAKGDFAKAAAAYERLVARDSSLARHWNQLARSAANVGNQERAAAAFEQAANRGAGPIAMYNAAAMNAKLGRRDRAFDLLDKVVAAGFAMPNVLKNDSDFVAFRAEPRYHAALAAMERAFMPCASDPDSRRFDFWIGEWDVKTPQGQTAGSSRIESVSGGCALLENWTDGRGGTGKSLNAYNRATRQWQQYWVGQFGAVTEYRESDWKDGSLRYYTPAASADSMTRMTFTPLPNGTVRQHGERSTDHGKTWTLQFDLYYHRRQERSP